MSEGAQEGGAELKPDELPMFRSLAKCDFRRPIAEEDKLQDNARSPFGFRRSATLASSNSVFSGFFSTASTPKS